MIKLNDTTPLFCLLISETNQTLPNERKKRKNKDIARFPSIKNNILKLVQREGQFVLECIR